MPRYRTLAGRSERQIIRNTYSSKRQRAGLMDEVTFHTNAPQIDTNTFIMEEKRKQHQQQEQSQGQQQHNHHQTHHQHENGSQQTQALNLENSTTIPTITTEDKQQAQISLTNVKSEAKIVETVVKEKLVKATIATEARKKVVKEAQERKIRMGYSKIKDFKMHQKQTASKSTEEIRVIEKKFGHSDVLRSSKLVQEENKIKAPDENQSYNKKRKIDRLEKPKALGEILTIESTEYILTRHGTSENENQTNSMENIRGNNYMDKNQEDCIHASQHCLHNPTLKQEVREDCATPKENQEERTQSMNETSQQLLQSSTEIVKLECWPDYEAEWAQNDNREEGRIYFQETDQQILKTPTEVLKQEYRQDYEAEWVQNDNQDESMNSLQEIESTEGYEEDHHMKHEYFETETSFLLDVFQERYGNENTLTQNVELYELYPKRNQRKHICYFKNCPNHLTSNVDVKSFKFPSNSRLRQFWIEHFPLWVDLSQKEKKTKRICVEHFEKQCLRETRLLYGSIPTLNLGVKSKIKRNCGESLKSLAKCRCKVPHCQRSQQYDDIFRVQFPQGELRTKWCFNLNLKEEDILPNDWICNQHFEKRVLFAKRPKADAVPTLCLGDAVKSSDLYQSPEYVMLTEFAKQCYEICCVKSCPNTIHNSDISFATLENVKNRDIYKKWLFNLDLEHSNDVRLHYRICLAHFESVCISSINRLKVGSIPTLNLDKKDNLFEIDRKFLENPRHNLSLKTRKKLAYLNRFSICQHPQCLKQRSSVQKWPYRGIFKTIWLQTMAKYPEMEHNNIKEQVAELDVCDDHFYILYKTNKTYMESFFQDEQGDLRELFEALKTIFDDLSADGKFIARRCAVPQCCTDQLLDQYRDITLHSFPKLPDVAAKCCYNCNIDSEISQQKNIIYKICKLHFEPYCFYKGSRYKWAVPTLNLPDSKPKVVLKNNPSVSYCKGRGSVNI